MSHPLDRFLADYHLEHELLCRYHENIKSLLRWVSSGLLFAAERQDFFLTRVQPTIAELLSCMRSTYGEEDPRLRAQDPAQLSSVLQAIAPLLKSDIEAALQKDPATEDPIEVLFCYPGFKAITAHRIAHVFYKAGLPLIPRMIAELAHQETGIDMHPGAAIGSHFFIDHGTGVVIGETAVIGSGVTLYQGVTLGAKSFARDATGRVIKGQPRHPILEDGVTVYSGATILGRITIGAGSIIGGNVWLTESVPPRSRITQQHYLSSFFRDGDGI